MAKIIDGEMFKNMIISAAVAVEQRKEEINSLNVFPVPDGDTGTNMSLTMANAARELGKLQNPTLGKALEVTSAALLRGARGNSGVITSLIFRGIAKSLKDAAEADGRALAAAIEEGADTAYKAVMKPAEGTMLTVCRVCGDAAWKASKKNREPEYVLSRIIEAGKEALEKTTEQNPVLKRAGVVDAGAFGLLIIFGGIQLALSGKLAQLAAMVVPTQTSTMTAIGADFTQFDVEEITFAYCTEFIAERTDKKVSVEKFKHFLNSIGDSVVVVEDETLVKVHIHTDTPDRALAEGLRFGMLSSIKIENMVEQLERQSRDAVQAGMGKRKIAEPEKKYGFVAVAAGDGVVELFRDLGVDNVVQGGQTMNPSTEDLLRAIDSTPAEIIYMLPNNKNIIMASQQAASLSEKIVRVIPSRSVPQGISALLSFEDEHDADLNETNMGAASKNVRSGALTYAARDSEFDGKKIYQGDFLALEEDKLLANARTAEDALGKLVSSMCKKGASFVTVIYGEGATFEQAEWLRRRIEELAPSAEINVISGGQPVYSYIISVE